MKHLLYLFIFFSATASLAQKKSKGDIAFEGGQYYEAIDQYIKEYAKASGIEDKGRIQYQLGRSYDEIVMYDKALSAYERAYNLGYQKYDKKLLLKYAEVQLNQGDYEGAQENFESYLKADPGNEIAKNGLRSCKKIKGWLAEPTRYKVKNESALNTENYDWALTRFDKKGDEYLFSSSRQGASGSSSDDITGENYTDLFVTRKDRNGNWGEPMPLPENINSEFHEGAATMNYKGDGIYFTRCGYEKKESNTCDIFYADQQGRNWKTPVALPLKDTAIYSVGHPTVDRREYLMIFASNMPGGQGGKDLWMSEFDRREDVWLTPKNLGPEINTPGDEVFPYIADDGSIYFSSNGHVGIGGLDIFHAASTGDNKWGKVENMGSPLNSFKDDFAFTFEKNSTDKGYFTSNREGGKGMDDIYSFELPEDKITITVKVFAHCDLTDPEDKGEALAGAKVTLTGSDGSSVQVTTNDEGMFTFDKKGNGRYVKKDVNYTIVVEKENHLIAKDKRSTMGVTGDKNLYTDLHLQRTDCGEITMPEVRYVFNEATLINDETISSNDSLLFVYNIMVENPTIIAELQAHTDCRGNDEYNQDLSQRRAQACVDFLVSKGIPKERLVAKGYGETQPRTLKDGTVLECDYINSFKKSDPDKFDRLHTLNRRTTFSILSFDYTPKPE